MIKIIKKYLGVPKSPCDEWIMPNCFDCQENSKSGFNIFSDNLQENIELVEEIFLQQKNYLAIKHDEKKNGCRKIKSKKIKDKCCEKYVKKGKNCKKCPLTNIIRN